MLSKYARTMDPLGGSEREEKYDVSTLAKMGLSLASISAATYVLTRQSSIQRMRTVPTNMRKFLGREFPWERTTAARAARQGSANVYKIPQSVLERAAEFNMPDNVESRRLIEAGIQVEITDLENFFDNNPTSTPYIDQARLEVFGATQTTSRAMIEDPRWATANLSQRYKKALRKYKSLFERIDADVAVRQESEHPTLGSFIRGEYRAFLHRQELSERLNDPVQKLSLSGFGIAERIEPTVTWGLPKNLERINVRRLLQGAERAGVLHWSDRDLFMSTPGYNDLNILRTETAVQKVYNALRKELAGAAHNARVSNVGVDELYSITPEIVNYGNGNLAVRLLMKLTREAQGDVVEDSIAIPLGNTGSLRFTRGGEDVVGPLRRITGELRSPAVQFATMVERRAGAIVGGMAVGETDAASKLNDVALMMRERVTSAAGRTVDIGVRLSVEDETIMQLNPAYKWPTSDEGSKIILEETLRRKRDQLRSLRYTAPESSQVAGLRDEIEGIKLRLGVGHTVSEQLREFNRQMGKMIDAEGKPLYFWERGATHAGAFRYASVFGESPLSLLANPQGSLYQFLNVYDLADDVSTVYPLRYGKGSLVHELVEGSYMSARIAFAGDLYPLSESEVYASEKFYRKITGSLAEGTGMKSRLRIPFDAQESVSIAPGQAKLTALLEELQLYGNTVSGELNPDAIQEIVEKHNVLLSPNKAVSVTDAGVEIKHSGTFTRKVVGATVDVADDGAKSLVLRLEDVNYAATRFRSVLGQARGIAKPVNIKMKTGAGIRSTDASRPIDFIVSGSIGKRVTTEIMHIGMVADAVESTLTRNRALSQIMSDVTASVTRKEAAVYEYQFNVQRLKNAAGIMGVKFNEMTNTMRMGRSREMYRGMRLEQVDAVLTSLGHVYDENDPSFREIKKLWDVYAERWTSRLGLPPEYAGRYAPRHGGPRWWSLIEIPEGAFLSPTALDMVGLMRQSHQEMLKTHGLITGVNAGIPFRYSELEFLSDRIHTEPEHVREAMLRSIDKYKAYLLGQMGGEAAGEGYLNIMEQLSAMEPPENVPVLRIGTARHTEFMRLIDTIDEKLKGGYKLAEGDLGILDPSKEFIGSWVELPWEVETKFAGTPRRTRFIKMAAPYQMKVKPTATVGAAGEVEYVIPEYYRRLIRTLRPAAQRIAYGVPPSGVDAARAQQTAMSLHALVESAMDEWLHGKKSVARMGQLTAWESGIQGLTMSMPRNVLRYGGKEVNFARYGPTDVVVSRKVAGGIQDVIRQNLIEKYSNSVTGELDRTAYQREFEQVMTGRKWFPVMGTRFPITAGKARKATRMWVNPSLDYMKEFADYIYTGELTQRGTLGDFDFDVYMFSIAKHWRGTEALEELLVLGEQPGKGPVGLTRLWEGTMEYELATKPKTALLTAGGREIMVPEVYGLRSTSGGESLVTVHVPKVDPKSGLSYITSETELLLGTGGEPARVMGGPLPKYFTQLVDEIDERGMVHSAMRVARFNKDRYMGLVMQKGFVGHATSYAMAMGLVAGEHLSEHDAALVRTTLGDWIQTVLKAKKLSESGMREQLHKFGTFTRAIGSVQTLDDVFGALLTAGREEGGWGVPAGVVESITRIPKHARGQTVVYQGLSYDILHRAVARYGSEKTVERIMSAIGVEQGRTARDVITMTGFQRMVEGITPPAAEPTGPNTGYWRRKPFMGSLKSIVRTTKTQDTMLADAISQSGGEAVKAGLMGAGVLGGLYLLFNFFRPHQSQHLGTMPGLGGEYWGPLSGSRMELPYGEPIDTSEYTWDDRPRRRKIARIEMYNPVAEAKRSMLAARVNHVLAPTTNWNYRESVAFSRGSGYNDYSTKHQPFDALNLILSSKMINI